MCTQSDITVSENEPHSENDITLRIRITLRVTEATTTKLTHITIHFQSLPLIVNRYVSYSTEDLVELSKKTLSIHSRSIMTDFVGNTEYSL